MRTSQKETTGRKAFELIIDMMLNKLSGSENKREYYLTLADLVAKLPIKELNSDSIGRVKQAILDPENRWFSYIDRIIAETNPHFAKMTLLNLLLNSADGMVTCGNTLTDNGSVSRGVCEVSADGYLTAIRERKKIIRTAEEPGAAFSEDDGNTWTPISADSAVSLNVWGFTPSFMKELEARFPSFLDRAMREDPIKGEYFLPSVVDELIREGKASAAVRMTQERWYGITYKEDKPAIMEAIRSMEEEGVYPKQF